LTDETPTVPDLDMVLQAIRVSNSPERWQESLRTYGPAVINDLNLLISLHNVASRLGGSDPEIANAITRWIEDLERKHSPHGLERLLISASSDAEIRQILEAHRHLVTPTFAMTALREVGRMCNTRSPIPVSLRGQATAPILHCVELIADFLGDEVVLAECHLMRSAVTSSTGDFAGSIPDLEIAAGMFEDRGDRFRQAQCVGLIGTNYLKLDRIEEAEGYLLRSVSLLEEHPEKDALLAPTYEELGQIAGRKNDLPTAGKYYSRAGQTRLRQGRTDKAALALQASVPFLLPEDEDQAFANADQFLALRLDTGKAGPSAELDETFMEIIARYLSGVVADAIDARDPLTGHSKNVNAEARLALAHRWALLAKRGLHMIKSAKARAYILFSAAAVALKNADPAAAAADAAAALPYFTSTDGRPRGARGSEPGVRRC
jgi:tetratricopeptide (TPR) repeat protein